MKVTSTEMVVWAKVEPFGSPRYNRLICGTESRARHCKCPECKAANVRRVVASNIRRGKYTYHRCNECGTRIARGAHCERCSTALARRAAYRKVARAKRILAAEIGSEVPANPAYPFIAGPCAYCGEEFVGRGTKARYCSDECRDQARPHRREWITPERRQKHYDTGAPCHICQQDIDYALRWPHPMSPSLDHLIPRSQGGGHEDSNLRPAHLLCNSIRRDTPLEEVAL